MTDYVVMFPADNEDERAIRTQSDRRIVFDIDFKFGQLLQAGGGRVTGGAAVALSRNTRTIRQTADGGIQINTGARTDSKEQLSGFFLVSCDNHAALIEAAEVLVAAHPVVEIWPVQGS